jgi:Tol biopolymer transport system component
VQGLDLGFDGFQLWAPALSSDGATLYFAAAAPGVPERIFAATRSQRGRRFSNAVLLPGLDSGTGDGTPLPSHDGLRLYFYSRRAGGNGERDLWLATRADPSTDFAAPALLEVVNTPALEHLPWLSADELTLLFVSTRAGGLGQSDVWLAQRPKADEAFAPPTLLRASSVSDEGRAVLSSSGRTLIFASDRAGSAGLQDLWSATRTEDAAEFGEATNLGSLNGPAMELDPFLSLDERELFFVSDRDGPSELWRAQRRCDD